MIRPWVDERKQLRPETLETGWHISTRYCVSQRHIPWYIAYLMVFTIQFEQYIPVSQKFSIVKHKQPRNKRWTISWAEHSSVHCTASISCRRVTGTLRRRAKNSETVSHCHTLKTGLYRKNYRYTNRYTILRAYLPSGPCTCWRLELRSLSWRI